MVSDNNIKYFGGFSVEYCDSSSDSHSYWIAVLISSSSVRDFLFRSIPSPSLYYLEIIPYHSIRALITNAPSLYSIQPEIASVYSFWDKRI